MIFAGSIGSFYLLPSGFLPTEDFPGACSVSNCRPAHASKTPRAVTARIAERLKQNTNVKSVFVNGGTIFGSGAEVRKATLIINLTPKGERKKTQAEIQEDIGRALCRDSRHPLLVLQDNGQRQFQLVVSGRDAGSRRQRRRGADEPGQAPAMLAQRRLDGRTRPARTARLSRSDIAADLGVSTEAISEAVRIATIGDIGANLAKFDVGDRQVPIRVQLPNAHAAIASSSKTCKVPTASAPRCRCRGCPTSNWPRARPPSTATTASGAF